MTIAPSIAQSQIQTALRNFLITILPSGTDVIEGQDNRVPEPTGTDFVVMTPILRPRIETNIDTPADVRFTASITGDELTVTNVSFGIIEVGATVFGVNVTANTTITGGTGSGGVGVYTVTPSQTVGSETMASGAIDIEQPTEMVIQLDFHSANVGDSSDMAQTVATLFRDEYATQQFASYELGVWPLYADDPKQIPFQNAEQQFETRWVVDVHLQANPQISVPQQFADETTLTVVNVEAAYPA